MENRNNKDPKYLTVKGFAAKVNFSERHIRRLIGNDTIEATRGKERRQWLIPQSEVSRFLGEPQPINEQPAILGSEGKQQSIPTELVSQAHIDPIIMKRREEHFVDLANIAKSLLSNGMDSVSSPGWTTNRSSQIKYLIPNQSAASGYDEITKEQLASRLNSNMDTILKDNDWFFRHCFIPHLKSELPEALQTELFFKVIERQPYQLIGILRVLAARKTFKGTCPACP